MYIPPQIPIKPTHKHKKKKPKPKGPSLNRILDVVIILVFTWLVYTTIHWILQ